jgi:hypothetical protein
LRVLCQRNRDGSHATQADRLRTLTLASRQLREAGFKQMRARSLKGKHVQALLRRWQDEGLSAGTLKNRLAHLRWWAEKVGKAGLIPADNAQLAVPDGRFVTNENKGRELGNRLKESAIRMCGRAYCYRRLSDCDARSRSSSIRALRTAAIGSF